MTENKFCLLFMTSISVYLQQFGAEPFSFLEESVSKKGIVLASLMLPSVHRNCASMRSREDLMEKQRGTKRDAKRSRTWGCVSCGYREGIRVSLCILNATFCTVRQSSGDISVIAHSACNINERPVANRVNNVSYLGCSKTEDYPKKFLTTLNMSDKLCLITLQITILFVARTSECKVLLELACHYDCL